MINQYNPNVVSAPGDTIIELLKDRSITINDLSIQIKQTEDFVNKLIIGEKIITQKIALQLEEIFGVPALFWINREIDYRIYIQDK